MGLVAGQLSCPDTHSLLVFPSWIAVLSDRRQPKELDSSHRPGFPSCPHIACHVVLCRAVLCRAVPCCVVLCFVALHFVILCHVPWRGVYCGVVWCVSLYCVVWCGVVCDV